jgi:hypothetical protein
MADTVNGLGTRVYFLDSATIERYLKARYADQLSHRPGLD